jgi:thymidylate synthase
MGVVQELARDQDSRRAVCTIYNAVHDLGHETKDMPCTLSLQFMIRHHELYLRTSMRSNDAYLGLPYDLQQFCMLLSTMAHILRLPVGTYSHNVGSMHLYERDFKRIQAFKAPTYVDLGVEPLFIMSSGDPLTRLADVTAFCQDLLMGYTVKPTTPFERWLAEALQ